MTEASHVAVDRPPAGWQAMVNEVQARIDAVDQALASLRIAVSHLTLAASHEEPQATRQEVETPQVTSSSKMAGGSETAQPVAPAFDESAREEVRRAVEQARNDMASGAAASTNGWTMPRDVWPGGPSPQGRKEVPARDEERSSDEWSKSPIDEAGLRPEHRAPAGPTPQPATELDADEKAMREAVRQAVERAKGEMTGGGLGRSDAEGRQAAESEEEAGREQVRRAVAQMRNEMTLGKATVSFEKPTVDEANDDEANDDEEAERQEAGRAERTEAEMASGALDDAEAEDGQEADSDEAGEEAAREEVRRAVAQIREEMTLGKATVSFERPAGDEADDDEEAKREEVRRAVEQARSDLTFGGRLSMYDDTAPPEADGLKPEETQSLFSAFAGADSSNWQGREPELLGLPASIIIEDSEGRVELARVYDTLNRVDRSQAALLNYTPHSVTVGLAALERLPEPEVMMAAVRRAFGRACRVTTEGTKMSVKIGEGEKAA